MNTVVGILTLIIGLAPATPLQPSAASGVPDPIRIRVFSQPTTGGFTDRETKWREDAVTDLKRLFGKKGRIPLVLVEEPEQADVTIEIQEPTFSGWSGKNLHALLTAGPYTKNFTASVGMTRGAAGSLHTQLRRWLDDNAKTVLAQRAH